jgi:sulfate/thiosulfate transport system substrate-binding protein
MRTPTRPRRLTAVLALASATIMGVSACTSSGGGGGKKINIVAFSVPKPAYDALSTAFKKTSAGKGVSFSSSYGPSGTQSGKVSSGQAADYVGFSLEPDMVKLVPKFVDSDWNTGATKGIVSSSVVVIVVRSGNPKHITGWDDLTKPGIKIVTPDPATSGSAKWNILAAYTHVLADGGTEDAAKSYLASFYKNIVSKPASGADATSTFTSGTGDVLISYENEAIAARQKGEKVDYVVPDESILIQNPGAVTKKASQPAKDFLSYVESAAGQKIFASKGFRPVDTNLSPGTVQGANDPSNPFPAVKKLTTIDSLGGWSKVNTEFFDPDNGIVTKIANAAG